MRVPGWAGLLAVVVVSAGCKSASSKAPTLTVSPSGTVQVAGSQVFTATVQNSNDAVAWSLSGPGSLSTASGYQTTYVAPSPISPTPATATLTASVSGVTQTVTLQLAPPPLGAQVIAGLSAPVKVEYDAQGIPHVFCAAMLDCMAVQGYLQAQDRLFPMDFLRRVARGRLASLIGPAGISQDEQILTLFVTRDGRRIEDALVAAMDAPSLAVLQAFSGGINAYLKELRQNPKLIPGEYAQLPTPITDGVDIPDWTPQDTYALARLQQFQLSESLSEESDYGIFAQAYFSGPLADQGKIHSWLRCQEPVHSYTLNPLAKREPIRQGKAQGRSALAKAKVPHGPAVQQMLAQVQDQMGQLRRTLGSYGLAVGSNNWVVDAAHSSNGHAMVANDPHLPLAYPPLFHLAGLTASDNSGLDVTGGAFPGIPGALVGRGAHVGWGVTVVGYDVTDIYLEKLTVDGSGHPAVTFNGAPVTLGGAAYTIAVRGGASIPFSVAIVPHHGPIISANQAALSAISVRWTGHEITNDLKGFLGLNLATAVGNVGDNPATSTTAFAALSNYATGAQNFVLADDQGNIGFDPHALVPLRPWAGTAPNLVPLLPWLPLPGDGSAEWGSGNAADNCNSMAPSANCWTADVDLPHGTNPDAGFFLTANSDPSGDTDDNNPIYNPARNPAGGSYLSFDWDDPTGFRANRIGERLLQVIADAGTVSVDDMVSIQTDHQVKLAKVLLPYLAAIPTGAQSPSFQAGLALFEQWSQDGFDCPTGLSGISPSSAPDTNAVHVRDSNACLLFHRFLRTAVQNIFTDDLAVAGLGVSEGPAIRALFYMLAPTTPTADTTFCNNVDGSGHLVTALTCTQQLEIALTSAFDGLSQAYGDPSNWLWGRVHTLTTTSQGAPLVGAPYAAGPFARPGGAETIDVGSPDFSNDPRVFSYSAGSNVRHISVMDPTNPLTKMQLPGYEHDVPQGELVSTGRDLLTPYVQNQYFTFAHGTQIDTQSGVVSVQTFTAQ